MAKGYEGEYYTVSEAARKLEVSSATIWRWINAGKLPAYRVGPRKIRINSNDLETMVKPARTEEITKAREREDIWAEYDPEKVKEALVKAAGKWADLDTDALIANLYRAREEGSRPANRP